MVAGEKKHTSNCHRFDTFITENKLPIPDLVKIDVEGASFEVLNGFGEFLEEVKIIQIETETKVLFTGQKLQARVIDLLKESHFSEIFRMKCCDGQYDSIFVNKKYFGETLLTQLDYKGDKDKKYFTFPGLKII